MDDDSLRRNIERGVGSVARFISLWIALGLTVQSGLNPLLSTLLLDDPLVVALSSGVTVIAAVYVYRRSPRIETGPL